MRIALISALAAIFGALAGGSFTYLATVKAEESQNDRQERRLEEEARGASRALVSRFATGLSYSGAILSNKEWLSFPPQYVAPIRPEDLRLVMARLSLSQYRDVDAALRDEESFVLLVDAHQGKPWEPGDRSLALSFRKDLLKGIRALQPVASLGG